MITSDCHLHTEFSADSEAPVREMIEEAIKKGLDAICFTDHDDYGFEAEGIGALKNPAEYIHTLQELREEYRDKIEIRIGVEIGMQPHLGVHFKELVRDNPFDFVIGSTHIVDGKDPYFGEMFDEMSDEEVYRHTFLHMAECMREVPDFDVVGHMDYIVRYGTKKTKSFSSTRLSDEIDEVLKTAVEMGKGIEINSVGLKYLGYCHPHKDILKRFRELGGEILTIGSDAHQPEYIAYRFPEVLEVIESCGYKYYTEFVSRKPVFKKI